MIFYVFLFFPIFSSIFSLFHNSIDITFTCTQSLTITDNFWMDWWRRFVRGMRNFNTCIRQRHSLHNSFKQIKSTNNICRNEKHCPNAVIACLFVNLNSLTFIRAELVRIWMHFTCIFNLNALFTRLCEKIMKSHDKKIKLNELASFLIVDPVDHSNSLEIEWSHR